MHSVVAGLLPLRWALLALLVWALSGPFAGANAADDGQERTTGLIFNEIRGQYATQDQLNAAVTKAYGVKLPPDKETVAREVMQALFQNRAFSAYLARIILPINRRDLTRAEVSSAIAEGILQLQVKGLARLGPEKQAAFVKHIIGMAGWVPAPLCKSMYTGRLDTIAATAVERRYVVQLPIGGFESITGLYRQAVEAELARFPDVRSINAQQASLAENVFQSASTKRLRAQLAQDAIFRVSNDAEAAPAAEVCAALSATLEGMLDMAEPYRSWQLIRFMQSMQ